METTIGKRIKKAWNPLGDRISPIVGGNDIVYSIGVQDTNLTPKHGFLTSVINRFAVDAASIKLIHAKVDENGAFKEEIYSQFNSCLNISANNDQSARAFIQDAVEVMLQNGYVGIAPILYDQNPDTTNDFDIIQMRAGIIVERAKDHVLLDIYDQNKGQRVQKWFPKSTTCICKNPFWSTMNGPNSSLQRLQRKEYLLDQIDDQIASKKLNIIIQLPYVVKTEEKEKQADKRRKSLEDQLRKSDLGVAYTDSTEKIVQLNKPLDSGIHEEILALKNEVFSQIGFTEAIMNGTANLETMQNYFTRVIEVIVSAIVDEMNRKYLFKESSEDKEAIVMFRDPFRLIPVDSISKIADTFTRNEIMTANEIRSKIGLKPRPEATADQLHNANIATHNQSVTNQTGEHEPINGGNQNGTEVPEL